MMLLQCVKAERTGNWRLHLAAASSVTQSLRARRNVHAVIMDWSAPKRVSAWLIKTVIIPTRPVSISMSLELSMSRGITRNTQDSLRNVLMYILF